MAAGSLTFRVMEPLDPPTPADSGDPAAPPPPPPSNVPSAGPVVTTTPAPDAPVVSIPTVPVTTVETTAVTDYGRIFAAEFVGTAVLVLCGPGPRSSPRTSDSWASPWRSASPCW